MANQFEWLLGSIEVSSDAPDGWRDLHILPFWEEPNNDAWGSDLSRYVMHETIHFWQLLSSSYLLDRLATEWLSFKTYRDTGELMANFADQPPLGEHIADDPFSAEELMECWARFWDIHSRSPAVIIEEEGHVGPPGRPLLVRDPNTGQISYTDAAFDWLMEHGPDQRIYVAPYQWLLDFFDGNSKAAIACFPIIVQASFGTDEPVRFFCNVVELLRRSQNFGDFVALQFPEYGLVNSLWFEIWKSVVTAVTQCSGDLNLPITWAIEQFAFEMHPIYRSYPARFEDLQDVLAKAPATEPAFAARTEVKFAATTKVGVFALPGIPLIRQILGNYLPPPRIRFANFDWYADLAVPGALAGMEGGLSGENLQAELEPLDDDVADFREAQWLAREGLSAV